MSDSSTLAAADRVVQFPFVTIVSQVLSLIRISVVSTEFYSFLAH